MTAFETVHFKAQVYFDIHNYLIAKCDYYEKQNDIDDVARAEIVRQIMREIEKAKNA